ncbi:MAG: UDP-glucose/GDP-mannose dehydrogenase family protein [Vulcanimicrobiaceae bacterium]
MRRICIIGAGYVGLVTAACLAELGNRVVCVEKNRGRLEALERGEVPFYEPGLSELLSHNQSHGRLSFGESIADGVQNAEIVFIAVGTPMRHDGHADIQDVREAALEIARSLDGPKIIVNKSTVPIETGDLVAAIIKEHRVSDFDIAVVSNPEFLREGSAITDFMKPDRVVLGVTNDNARSTMEELYAPLEAPIIVTDIRTAELIKYAANTLLAARISLINEIAAICERMSVDVKDVARGVGSDHRIGTMFLSAGLGFGGSCLPKDVTALSRLARDAGVHTPLLESILEINASQIERAATRLSETLEGLRGKTLAVLGLAFKANTDDVRESPSIALIQRFLSEHATVVAHDPVAKGPARERLGNSVRFSDDLYEAVVGADAVCVATDWNEYKQIDFEKVLRAMRGNVIFDGRNIYDPARLAELGFTYLGVGRAVRFPTKSRLGSR